jgi:hypothetical protein
MTLAFRLILINVLATGALAAAPAVSAHPQPTVKVLPDPADPTKKTIVVGRARAAGMIIQFELEPAKAMWMSTRTPVHSMEHPVGPAERYHVEVKPIAPRSKPRISYDEVTFVATNKDNGRKVEGILHPSGAAAACITP